MKNASRRALSLEGPILKSLLVLSFPIVLANILQAGYQLTDAFWVGRLGASAVAAVSVSFPVAFLSIALGAGLAIAGSTLIAQYVGAKNERMVNHVASQTLLMVVIVSIVLSVIGYALTPFILKLMGVDHEVYVLAVRYMRVSFIGLVFNFAFFMFQSIMRGIGENKLSLYIVGGTVLLNFILDPLFIFGWGSIPALGVMGAAIATLTTQMIAAGIGLSMLFGGRYGIHLSLRDFLPDLSFIKRAFFLGLPASIEMSARALSLTVMTFLVASFGTLAVASYGAGSNIIQMIIIPAVGLSMAISVLAGQNIGAGNIERASHIGKVGAWLGFWVLTSTGLIVFMAAPHIIAFFVPGDGAVIAGATVFLRTVSLFWGLFGVEFALNGVLRASGSMVIAMCITIVSQWVIQFPAAYLLSKHTHMGINGVWWAFPISSSVITIVVIAIYTKGNWKKKRLIKPEERLAEQVSEEILIEESYANRQGA